MSWLFGKDHSHSYVTRKHIAFNKKARAEEEATSVHMGSDKNREVAVSPDQISSLRVHLRDHTNKQTHRQYPG